MENTTKRYGKALCFTPLTCYLLWFFYYIFVNRNVVAPNHLGDHIAIVTNTITNYSSLFFGLAMSSIITATILVYFIVHLARLKDMEALEKIGWIVFMTFLAPVAFIVFWYTELSTEPDNISVHPSIN